jgi:hypothetical protein
MSELRNWGSLVYVETYLGGNDHEREKTDLHNRSVAAALKNIARCLNEYPSISEDTIEAITIEVHNAPYGVRTDIYTRKE